MSSRNVIEILRIHWRRQIFQKVLYIYLFDYQFKKVASRIILLFISTLMVSYIYLVNPFILLYNEDYGVNLYCLCFVEHF